MGNQIQAVKRRRNRSNSEMLNLLRMKAVKYGKPPTKKELDMDINMPSYTSYRYRFGSYNKALRKAGLIPNIGKTENEMLKLLRRKARELGRIPTKRELNSDKSIPNYETYRVRFGNYGTAVKKAGLKR